MEDKSNLLKRLSKYPALGKRLEEILDVIENTSGEVTLADTAELCIIKEGRQLNQEALTYWANRQSERQANAFEQRHEQVSKSGKKNSTGKPVLEGFKSKNNNTE